jgi:hypothetical protein
VHGRLPRRRLLARVRRNADLPDHGLHQQLHARVWWRRELPLELRRGERLLRDDVTSRGVGPLFIARRRAYSAPNEHCFTDARRRIASTLSRMAS